MQAESETMAMMTGLMADPVSRARAGEAHAFRELTEPHCRELRVHGYRMPGSFQDAEDNQKGEED